MQNQTRCANGDGRMSKNTKPNDSYYKTQQTAFIELSNRIERDLGVLGKIPVERLIFDLTQNYPISQRAIENRIYLIVSLNPKLEIVNREIRAK
jgi:hypothetical protein